MRALDARHGRPRSRRSASTPLPPSTNGELKHLAFIGARTRKRYLVGRWETARSTCRSTKALRPGLRGVPLAAVAGAGGGADPGSRDGRRPGAQAVIASRGPAGPSPLAVERQSYLVDSSFNA